MGLDYPTLLAAMSFTIIPLAAVFFVDKLRRPADDAGRYWSLTFVSAVLCSVAYYVSGSSHDIWWSVAVGNAAMVLTLGSVWMGCRAFNGRRPFVLGVGAVALLVGVVSALPSHDGSRWAGAPEKMLGLALFSVLVVAESLRPRLRRFAGAWVLAGTLAVHGVYVVLRSLAYLVAGPGHPLFEGVFGSAGATGINLVLVVLGGAGIIAIRVQDARRGLSRRDPSGARERVLGAKAFDQLARRRLTELPRAAFLVGTIDLLGELRGAYGVAHGRELQRTLTRLVVRDAPAGAVIGVDGDRWLLMFGADDASESLEPLLATAHRLATALHREYETQTTGIDDASSASFGVVVAAGVPYEELLTAASAALVRDADSVRGRIAVGAVGTCAIA
ncbi:hypothetical protein [Herbiconiux sp. A18JL235]|uniref:GGDEF domain-containing protein n=1 Tax=Herbiconiux sp. A18JL235 TaxID=3152363 RepID=A0AB39BIP5_9MICO